MLKAPTAVKCGSCGSEIESCFCEAPDCQTPRCNNCVALVLKERIPEPHHHDAHLE